MRTALFVFLALSACADPHPNKDKGGGGNNKPPGEDFVADGTVRITAPTNGEAVDPTFTIWYQTGEAVTDVALATADGVVAEATQVGRSGSLVVTLEEGRQALTLTGFNAEGVETSRHNLAVTVVGSGAPWVAITSPADGATVPNPVRFALDAADDVDTIELYADDWLLGSVSPGELLTYDFTGTGFERQIEAIAYVDGAQVATDAITLTVEEASTAELSNFNAAVMDRIEAYPTDGSYDYYWPSDSDWGGNPHDLYYLDRLFSAGDPERRSFCVGLTFEVFLFAFDEVDAATGGTGSLNGVSFDELYELRTDWFVRELYGMGVVDALENYGIGDRISDWEDIQPGDFLQFWRHSGSGHNNIFIDWETDGDGTIIGVTYWSTQGSTDGVDYNTEYFGTSGSRIDPNSFFAGRARMPVDWEPWR